jgi:large subunit ribosomal protein L1
VTRPKATFEIVIKTGMPKGTTVPKGRMNLPRSAKQKSKEVVLAFAEGRQADEAKRAGVDIVGGPELVDGVSMHSYAHRVTLIFCRLSMVDTKRQRFCARPLSSVPLPQNWDVFLVPVDSCPRSVVAQ